MSNLSDLKPKNQWAFVIFLLIEYKERGITMLDAIKKPNYFYKFQTRLLELEKERASKLKIRRLPVSKKNRFGHFMTFINYKSLANKKYLINLFHLINKTGQKTIIIKKGK